MEKIVKINIDIDKENCGKKCNYQRSLAQFSIRCLLFGGEELKHIKSETKNNIYYSIYKRCDECLSRGAK